MKAFTSRVVSGLLAIAFASPASLLAQAWAMDKPCLGTTPQMLHLAKVAFQETPCLQFSRGWAVCQRVSNDSAFLSVSRGVGDTLRLVGEPVSTWSPQDTTEVIQADLDHDGTPELMIPWFEYGTNGMGIGHWTVYVLSMSPVGWPPSADSVDVEDYATAGSWVRVNGTNHCDLLKTSWVNGTEPVRGEGLYLEARWMAWSLGRFVEEIDRPVLHRRFLKSFDEERDADSIPDAPFGWLRGARF